MYYIYFIKLNFLPKRKLVKISLGRPVFIQDIKKKRISKNHNLLLKNLTVMSNIRLLKRFQINQSNLNTYS